MRATKLDKIFTAGGWVIAAIAILTGCERKERIIDIKTPLGNVKVDRNRASGDVDVDVNVTKEKDVRERN